MVLYNNTKDPFRVLHIELLDLWIKEGTENIDTKELALSNTL
jgi:hypothetical protein